MYVRSQFTNKLNYVKNLIIEMRDLVAASLSDAITAITTADVALAKKIAKEDKNIDKKQIKIEDACAQLIATEQPVATALREIICALKTAAALERIGDHIRRLTKLTKVISHEPFIQLIPSIKKIATICHDMLCHAIDTYITLDAQKAKEIAAQDNSIDKLHDKLYKDILYIIHENTDLIEEAVFMLFTNRYLERIGDHVTNICEWVIYSTTGAHIELN